MWGGGGEEGMYIHNVKHVHIVLSAELCVCVGGGGGHVHTRCETCVRPRCEDYVRGYCSKMVCNVPCASTCVKTN